MKTLIISLFVMSAFFACAQEYETPKVNLGLGMGMDYGGFGARLSVSPVPVFGVFGAAGFNLHKVGVNFGGILRLRPEKKICPVLMGMYGYNGVIVVVGKSEYNKTYYGPTVAGGMELRFKSGNYLNFELLVPFRQQEWEDDWRAIEDDPDVNIAEPLPVGIGLGFHFKI